MLKKLQTVLSAFALAAVLIPGPVPVSAEGGITFTVGKNAVNDDGTITTPISISADSQATAFDFDIDYDNTKVSFLKLTKGPAAGDSVIQASNDLTQQGRVRFVYIASEPLTEAGVFFSVKWQPLNGTGTDYQPTLYANTVADTNSKALSFTIVYETSSNGTQSAPASGEAPAAAAGIHGTQSGDAEETAQAEAAGESKGDVTVGNALDSAASENAAREGTDVSSAEDGENTESGKAGQTVVQDGTEGSSTAGENTGSTSTGNTGSALSGSSGSAGSASGLAGGTESPGSGNVAGNSTFSSVSTDSGASDKTSGAGKAQGTAVNNQSDDNMNRGNISPAVPLAIGGAVVFLYGILEFINNGKRKNHR